MGVPGVTQWRLALPLLKVMGARTVFIAFDAPDMRTKAPVFDQAEAFWRELVEQGYDVSVEDWDDEL